MGHVILMDTLSLDARVQIDSRALDPLGECFTVAATTDITRQRSHLTPSLTLGL